MRRSKLGKSQGLYHQNEEVSQPNFALKYIGFVFVCLCVCFEYLIFEKYFMLRWWLEGTEDTASLSTSLRIVVAFGRPWSPMEYARLILSVDSGIVTDGAGATPQAKPKQSGGIHFLAFG